MSASPIPVQNVYYLLAYAWDHFRAGEELNVSDSECPNVHNLLAMLLSRGIKRLPSKGIDRDYREFVEATPRLRGRVDVLASHRRMTHLSGRMICEFDELTIDTLPNQILKATCRLLLRCSVQLSKDNKRSIRQCLEILAEISDIRL